MVKYVLVHRGYKNLHMVKLIPHQRLNQIFKVDTSNSPWLTTKAFTEFQWQEKIFWFDYLISVGHFICHLSHQDRFYVINQASKFTRSQGIQDCQVFIYQRQIDNDMSA